MPIKRIDVAGNITGITITGAKYDLGNVNSTAEQVVKEAVDRVYQTPPTAKKPFNSSDIQLNGGVATTSGVGRGSYGSYGSGISNPVRSSVLEGVGIPTPKWVGRVPRGIGGNVVSAVAGMALQSMANSPGYRRIEGNIADRIREGLGLQPMPQIERDILQKNRAGEELTPEEQQYYSDQLKREGQEFKDFIDSLNPFRKPKNSNIPDGLKPKPSIKGDSFKPDPGQRYSFGGATVRCLFYSPNGVDDTGFSWGAFGGITVLDFEIRDMNSTLYPPNRGFSFQFTYPNGISTYKDGNGPRIDITTFKVEPVPDQPTPQQLQDKQAPPTPLPESYSPPIILAPPITSQPDTQSPIAPLNDALQKLKEIPGFPDLPAIDPTDAPDLQKLRDKIKEQQKEAQPEVKVQLKNFPSLDDWMPTPGSNPVRSRSSLNFGSNPSPENQTQIQNPVGKDGKLDPEKQKQLEEQQQNTPEKRVDQSPSPKCQDPCIADLQNKAENPKEKTTKIKIKQFKACKLEPKNDDDVADYTQVEMTVLSSVATSTKLMFDRLFELEKEKCRSKFEIPETMALKVPPGRSILKITYREIGSQGKLKDSKWVVQVPWYNGGKQGVPKVSYTHGTTQVRYHFADGSKVVVNAKSEAEGKRLIRALIAGVSKDKRKGGKYYVSKSITESGEDNGFKAVQLVPTTATYYAKGTGYQGGLPIQPTWRVNLRK